MNEELSKASDAPFRMGTVQLPLALIQTTAPYDDQRALFVDTKPWL